MKLYSVQICETGEELCIAARTNNHAAEVLTTFWCARSGMMPGRFEIEPGVPDAYSNHPYVSFVADGELAGVVIRQLDGSMVFEPADT